MHYNRQGDVEGRWDGIKGVKFTPVVRALGKGVENFRAFQGEIPQKQPTTPTAGGRSTMRRKKRIFAEVKGSCGKKRQAISRVYRYGSRCKRGEGYREESPEPKLGHR